MTALAIVAVLLAVGLAVAVVQAVMLADQVDALRDERDRAVKDRDTSARAFAAKVLLEIAYDLSRDAERRRRQGTAVSRSEAEVFQGVADWVENVRVPEVGRRDVQPVEATR